MKYAVSANLHYADDPLTHITRHWSSHPTFGGACDAAYKYARQRVSKRLDPGAIIDSVSVHDERGKLVFTVSSDEEFV